MDEQLTIGRVAKQANVNIQTLRYYARKAFRKAAATASARTRKGLAV